MITRQTICIIPARGGSTRIPRKNIRPFHGYPIIVHSILKAQASGLFNRIIVSTDDDEIAAIALAQGIEVWKRDANYGRNEVGTQEVARECLVGLQIPTTSVVCCLYATAPLLSVGDLRFGYRVLLNHPEANFVYSVGDDPLCDAGQFYWGWAISFLLRNPLVSIKSLTLPISWRRVCDINTEEDWERAEEMFTKLKDNDDD